MIGLEERETLSPSDALWKQFLVIFCWFDLTGD